MIHLLIGLLTWATLTNAQEVDDDQYFLSYQDLMTMTEPQRENYLRAGADALRELEESQTEEMLASLGVAPADRAVAGPFWWPLLRSAHAAEGDDFGVTADGKRITKIKMTDNTVAVPVQEADNQPVNLQRAVRPNDATGAPGEIILLPNDLKRIPKPKLNPDSTNPGTSAPKPGATGSASTEKPSPPKVAPKPEANGGATTTPAPKKVDEVPKAAPKSDGVKPALAKPAAPAKPDAAPAPATPPKGGGAPDAAKPAPDKKAPDKKAEGASKPDDAKKKPAVKPEGPSKCPKIKDRKVAREKWRSERQGCLIGGSMSKYPNPGQPGQCIPQNRACTAANTYGEKGESLNKRTARSTECQRAFYCTDKGGPICVLATRNAFDLCDVARKNNKNVKFGVACTKGSKHHADYVQMVKEVEALCGVDKDGLFCRDCEKFRARMREAAEANGKPGKHGAVAPKPPAATPAPAAPATSHQ